VKNSEVFHRGKEESNTLHTAKQRKNNWIGQTLHKICLLKHVVEEKIEVTGRRRRRRKQLLNDLNGNRRYLNLKAEALERTLWRTGFGLGKGSGIKSVYAVNGYALNNSVGFS
jgi:hypothetical protein